MRLFISWSGKRSGDLAELFGWWLPTVIQPVKPWISASDIEKGARWSTEISNQLQDINFGLICLTSDNLTSPWILFEAGALSKSIDKTFVCPYLLDIEPLDIQGPLAQFQAAKSTKEDTKQLIETINRALNNEGLDKTILDRQFDRWWPDLEKGIAKISSSAEKVKLTKRDDREILEEILSLVRSFSYTNESLVAKIQQAFPNLNQEELSRLLDTLIKWLADGIEAGNTPARLVMNKDGTMSVNVLSFEDKNKQLSAFPSRKSRKTYKRNRPTLKRRT
jgi:hypothetical protein